jgi:tetratricopeptide (TPR) repeat protein
MRYRAGAYDEAVGLLETAVAEAHASGEATVEERALAQLAGIVEAQGDWARARRQYAAVEALARGRGSHDDVAHCQANRAALAAVLGEDDEAERLAGAALVAAEASRSRPAVAFVRALGGVVALERSDAAAAEERYRAALDGCLEAGLTHWALDCLGGLAAAAVLRGEGARAARLFAAVDAAFEREGIPPEPGPERASHERCRRLLWSGGHRQELANAAAAGAALGLDDAVRLARRAEAAVDRSATVTPRPLLGRAAAGRR